MWDFFFFFFFYLHLMQSHFQPVVCTVGPLTALKCEMTSCHVTEGARCDLTKNYSVTMYNDL